MRCGKHIMPETGVERFTYSGAARYPPFRATEPQPLRGAHAVTFLPLVFDIATIWLRLRRAGIFATGFSDVEAQRMLGCMLKEMGSYISWGQLTAASGLVAITYTNREPAKDVHAVLQHVRQNAKSLDIDENRIGL